MGFISISYLIPTSTSNSYNEQPVFLQWADYQIIVERLQLIEEVIKNILGMLTAVAKDALSVYFAKNAASRGYYWSYASHLYEEKKKNLMYITPRGALNSLYSENSGLDEEFTEAERVVSSMETSSLGNFIIGIGYVHNLQVLFAFCWLAGTLCVSQKN